jgi:hypothetical protein
MSAIEFGLISQTPFVYAAAQPTLAHGSTGLESLSTRYELLAQISRLMASMDPEIVSRDLVAVRFCEHRYVRPSRRRR